MPKWKIELPNGKLSPKNRTFSPAKTPEEKAAANLERELDNISHEGRRQRARDPWAGKFESKYKI
jgi:hypothetical protein